MLKKKSSYKFVGRKHSRHGIISALIGILILGTFLVIALISGIHEGKGSLTMGIIGIVSFALAIFGFINGAKGAKEKDIYYVAPVFGLICNGLFVILYFCLYIIGIFV